MYLLLIFGLKSTLEPLHSLLSQAVQTLEELGQLLPWSARYLESVKCWRFSQAKDEEWSDRGSRWNALLPLKEKTCSETS